MGDGQGPSPGVSRAWDHRPVLRLGCQAKKGSGLFHVLCAVSSASGDPTCFPLPSVGSLLVRFGESYDVRGFWSPGPIAGGNVFTLPKVKISEQMVPERARPEALPHPEARPMAIISAAKSGRLSALFIQGGEALPVSTYIEIKPLSRELEDVLQLSHCSHPLHTRFTPTKFSPILGAQLANSLLANLYSKLAG